MTLRYQKNDGRFATTNFKQASLADGRDHHVMLHASGLQRGPPRLSIYVDCRLVHTINDLPAAFGTLPAGPNTVALRSLPVDGQVSASARALVRERSPSDWARPSFPRFKNKLTDLKLVIEDTIDNVATLQDCNVDQGQPLQLLGQNTEKTYRLTFHDKHMLPFLSHPSEIQGARMVHDQATVQELKSMFAEMKALLQQQVICCWVSLLTLKSITSVFPQVLAGYI